MYPGQGQTYYPPDQGPQYPVTLQRPEQSVNPSASSLRQEDEESSPATIPTPAQSSASPRKKTGRSPSPKKKVIPPVPELDSFAWDEEKAAWVDLEDLDIVTRTAMEEHTESLRVVGGRFAAHYHGPGDRIDGICTGCKHKLRNSLVCDTQGILTNHLACTKCCETGIQTCGTLIQHPDPAKAKYAIGYVPLPPNKRVPGSTMKSIGFWVNTMLGVKQSKSTTTKIRDRAADLLSGRRSSSRLSRKER